MLSHPVAGFIDGSYRHINPALRGDALVDVDIEAQHFIAALASMNDYVGTSYRVSQIAHQGLATLLLVPAQPDGTTPVFIDAAPQAAFVLPGHAAAWAQRAPGVMPVVGMCRLFSIFDESVPQKNLSTPRHPDLVVVVPDTPLRLKALRIVPARERNPSAARDGRHDPHDPDEPPRIRCGDRRPYIVAHFGAAADTHPHAPRYVLFSGARQQAPVACEPAPAS